MSIINKSDLKRLMGDFKTAEEFYPSLNKKVEEIVRDAIKRAKANQRRTVMARDI